MFMSKVAVVYWSGTGNTEAMANAVAEGVSENGGIANLYCISDFNSSMIEDFDAIAFGCPAMGGEVLEEEEFEPMFNSCEPKLKGKKIALFGSYGWGDGEWIEIGRKPAEMMVQFYPQKVLYAMVCLMMKQLVNAEH